MKSDKVAEKCFPVKTSQVSKLFSALKEFKSCCLSNCLLRQSIKSQSMRKRIHQPPHPSPPNILSAKNICKRFINFYSKTLIFCVVLTLKRCFVCEFQACFYARKAVGEPNKSKRSYIQITSYMMSFSKYTRRTCHSRRCCGGTSRYASTTASVSVTGSALLLSAHLPTQNQRICGRQNDYIAYSMARWCTS